MFGCKQCHRDFDRINSDGLCRSCIAKNSYKENKNYLSPVESWYDVARKNAAKHWSYLR